MLVIRGALVRMGATTTYPISGGVKRKVDMRRGLLNCYSSDSVCGKHPLFENGLTLAKSVPQRWFESLDLHCISTAIRQQMSRHLTRQPVRMAASGIYPVDGGVKLTRMEKAFK